MFGEKIDYVLLKPITHRRNRATEEELNAKAREIRPFDPVAARRRLEKLMARFEGNLAIDPRLSYLDVGCGRGDLALALIQAGATDVTGIDIVGRQIEAAQVVANQFGSKYRPHFICADINTWRPDRKYDVVISHEALEHISQPEQFIKELAQLVNPDGLSFLAFGPLFHSPVGDHLQEFFRVFLPWRGVLFSERALMRLREECFRPGDPVRRFQEMIGGLNLMRFSEFVRYVDKAGFDVLSLNINPQLKSVLPAYWISEMLRRTPARDYFVASVYAMLRPRVDQQGLSSRIKIQ